ncbi:MAG: TolC family protein [Kiritimatiellae bacterium]|nr:TolC family protein [Kiritimatiellia bacterium]
MKSVLALAAVALAAAFPAQGGLRAGVARDGATPTGEEALGPDATLDECLAYAAEHNPQLQAAVKSWQAAGEQAAQAGSLPDPQFGYTYYVQPVETRVGPQRQSLSFSQRLPWAGKLRTRARLAETAAEAAREQLTAARLTVFYEIRRAYYGCYYLARAIAVTEAHVGLVKSMEHVAMARYKTGATPQTAVIKAQVELGLLEDRLNSLREERLPLRTEVNALLGRPRDAPIPWPTELPAERAAAADAEWHEALGRSNPQLRRQQALVRREDLALDLARQETIPDLTFGVVYVDTADAEMAGVSDGGKDPVMASVSVNLPLWRGRYRAGVREAHARREAAARALADLRNRLGAELATAISRGRDAGRKVRLYHDTLIPQSRQAVEVARQSFEAGQADFMALIDAQRLLLELELNGEQARTERYRREAQIDMLTGKGLTARND